MRGRHDGAAAGRHGAALGLSGPAVLLPEQIADAQIQSSSMTLEQTIEDALGCRCASA